MATFQDFEEIEAWQKARELTQNIYRISSQGKLAKDFGLRDQMRRASVSIMLNIAEGFERSGTGEFVQFLAISKGSSGELKSHLYVAVDQEYISNEEFEHLCSLACEVNRMIAGLMHYLSNSKIKGIKYKRLK